MKRIIIVICALIITTGCSKDDNIKSIEQVNTVVQTQPTQQGNDRISQASNIQVKDLIDELAIAKKENQELKEEINNLNEKINSSDTGSIIAVSPEMMIEYFCDRGRMGLYDQKVPINELLDLIDKGAHFKQIYIDIDALPTKCEQTDDIYFNQDGTKKEELMSWYQVDFNGIDTIPELEEYLMGIYTQEMADEIITEYFDFKYTDEKRYMVYDGYLFSRGGGRGSNITQTPLWDIETGKIESYSEADGNLTFKYILPIVYYSEVGDYETASKIDFEQANYEFRNTVNGWRLNTFLSLPKEW